MNDIGALIRELRIKQGLTQEQLGELVGMTQSQISLLEKQGTDRISIVRMMASVFRMTLIDMLTILEGENNDQN